MDDGADLSLTDDPGLVVGRLVGVDAGGRPLVQVETAGGADVLPARSAVRLDASAPGDEVVVMFECGDPGRPIVLGRLQRPARPPDPVATADGERVVISAEQEVTLTCGKASITLSRSGKIVLRGTYILSRSTGPNRIRGGSIQLN